MQADRSSLSVTYRELLMAAAAVTVTLIGIATFNALRADASVTAGESTFVPLPNCRLLDTRPQPQFNIGPRTTPVGPDEVHRQKVTGTVGACNIPSHATAVSLNVTAIQPTAPSFLTVYPYAPTPPNASNLNFVPGGAPVPNKVDVRLSTAGELGFYNLAGSVHLAVDVTGYYTAIGLKALTTALDTKADLDDVHTKAQVGALLSTKADTANVYTKAEVDARTQLRSIAFPILALNLPDHAAFDPTTTPGEMWWADDTSATAGLSIARPADWTGTSPVTVRIHFTRTPNAGDALFRLAVRAYDAGDVTNGPAAFVDTAPQAQAGQNIAREAVAEIPAGDLDGGWWHIAINRRDIVGDYDDPLFVRSISIEYEATT